MSRILNELLADTLPTDAKSVLENFDEVIQGVFPANSRQLSVLPKQILDLSHQMTDERARRRLGYMNDKTALFAYSRYFMWWNLVRMTRLFCNIDFSFLKDGDFCLDIGSGPLTAVCALWLARPELRQKKLVWNAMDISQQALNFGEEIFLSIAAKTPAENSAPWKIIRTKGALGDTARQKAAFVVCANVFNEILQAQKNPPDFLAKKYSKILMPYLDEKRSALFLLEPGVPYSARFVSLMRDAFLRGGFEIGAPCPHSRACPMDGRRLGQSGASGKWCNFAFDTAGAPKKLLALSKKASLPKERAVLSFLFAQRSIQKKPPALFDTGKLLRVVSDPIRLPAQRVGYYSCAKDGLTLAVVKSGIKVKSGDLVLPEAARGKSEKSFVGRKSRIEKNTGEKNSIAVDKKTGAKIVEI